MCCSWPVLGAMLASFGRSWGGLGSIFDILGLVKGGQARSGQVRSGQVRSRWPGGPPGSGGEARSGQGGVPPSYKDGSSPWPRLAEELPSKSGSDALMGRMLAHFSLIFASLSVRGPLLAQFLASVSFYTPLRTYFYRFFHIFRIPEPSQNPP